MRHIQEIIKDIETQLNWSGPNGKKQGIITLPRDDMYYVLQHVKSSEIYAKAFNVNAEAFDARED